MSFALDVVAGFTVIRSATGLNWEIEVPVNIGAKTYRVDAMRPSNSKIREFVHSLSPYYIEKHTALANAGYKVMWILDGDKFVSKRARCTRRSPTGVRGIYNFLKPAAEDLCASLTKHVMVHYDNQLWSFWNHGVWYPIDTDTTKDLTRLYQEADVIKA